MNSPANDEVRKQAQLILERVNSLQMATLDEQGEPCISYTPYIVHNDCFYIFVSELSDHTRHLKAHTRAQVLLIEDESSSKNIFARKRIIAECSASFIERSDPAWTARLQDFEARHGNTVALLKSLSDFWLIRLSPEKGRVILGFGQAYLFNQLDFGQVEAIAGNSQG